MSALARGITWTVCLCVFVCVLSSRCLVCRPSHLCVCRVGTPPARKYIHAALLKKDVNNDFKR